MPFTKSFGKGALEALRGLVTSFKGLAKGNKGASKGFRVSGAGARWGLGGRNRPRKAEPNFVVLVFIKYTGWIRESQESMQLNSVENDLAEVLKYLGYRHGDTNTTWRLLIDFDLKYTDDAGQTKVLKGINPTRAAILNAIEESGKTGRSGLVYFGGHGEYATRGTSVLKPIQGGTQYTVTAPVDTQEGPSETKSSFLLAIDGGRIYGEDIISCLPEEVSGECIHTVAIDACHSAGVAS
ncbi:hypothetical protein M407DRAFT_90531 [Tulasnella calospora MUT 4182]|uniref:Uncharacterized protein n=1 Tax=Tulasnella calospora MUT 4182 TaxID=1051891 RepID=A0A0C3MGU3_9AGAM|nr:hypothetical protein M407DRAFT_90531 [Tulasnella calospora MUT 4182]